MSDPRAQRLLSLVEADPEAAKRLLKKLQSKVLVPHSKGQAEVLTAEERFLILCAGRRWGKTRVGAARALREARKDNQIVWWVAPIYKNVKRGYAEVLRQLPHEMLAHPAPPDTAFDAGRSVSLRLKNGSRIEFYSADRPEGMLGGSADFVVLDEAATMPENVWFQTLQPLLADRQGGALLISTPRGKNWFYRLWMNGQDELITDFKSWRFPSFTNPTIPKSEWDRQKEILPQVIYEQEVLAEFVSAAASVFRFVDEDVVPIQRPKGHVILGIDLAKYNDFTVICGLRPDRVPCYHDRFNAVSWPAQRKRIMDAVAALEGTPGVTGVSVVLDATGGGDVVNDELNYAGLDTIPIKFTNTWKQQAVTLLGSDLERGLVKLCPEQVKEFESYAYTISESTGRWKFEAGTGHDDEVSAMLLAYWGLMQIGVPDVGTLGEFQGLQLEAGAPTEEIIEDAEVVDGMPVVDELLPVPINERLWDSRFWSS